MTGSTTTRGCGARQILASEFANLTVDLVVQPNHDRRKKLLVADMESTIIENEMLDELADSSACEEVAEVTRRHERRSTSPRRWPPAYRS
jgi:phosphoserine phosphatase